jgi:pimeloyl-ACP methyl ester carboxylesterase
MLSTKSLGTGTPLVVLPGFGLDQTVMAAAFEPIFAAAEPGRGYRRIYLDLPGTGDSPAVQPCSDAVLAAIEQSLAELLGEEPFLAAGHSYGGYLAAGLARRRPDQVAGLLLVCHAVRIGHRNLQDALTSVPEPDWLADVPEELRSHFAQAIGTQTREVATRIAQLLAQRAPADEEFLTALQQSGYRLSDEDSQAPFTGPATVVAGQKDRIAGHLDQSASLARYPDGDYRCLAAAGHYLPLEQPADFAAVTQSWLARSERL